MKLNLVIILPWLALSYPNYVRNIPNGEKVKFNGESWPGVGHSRVFGGGDLNSFGKDFMKAGNQWTEELCRKDSDDDGRTNGEELGDINCTWKIGDPNPPAKFVTHPGIADECPTPAPAPSMMKIAIIGSGNVGKALMNLFLENNVNAAFGVRNLETHSAEGPVMEMKEAAEWGTLVILAVPGNAVSEATEVLKPFLKGKVVIDATNPLTWDKGPVWSPPKEGSNTALLASLLPDSKVVKAFNTFGSEHIENPSASGSDAHLFIAGDDIQAKKTVIQLADRLGFVPIDSGPLRNAAVLENMATLWVHLATVGRKGRDFTFALVGADL